jgi:hypothetical protein
MAEEIITGEMRGSLKESFKLLASEVNMHVFTRKGLNDQYSAFEDLSTPYWKGSRTLSK